MKRLHVVLVAALVGFCASMAVVHGWRGQPLASSEARASWVPAQAATKVLLGQALRPSGAGGPLSGTTLSLSDTLTSTVAGGSYSFRQPSLSRLDIGGGADDFLQSNGTRIDIGGGVGSVTTLTAGPLIIGNSGTAINSSMRGTATLDFASAAAGACSAVLTITVTGAVAGTEVALGVADASNTTGSDFFAWVSATNTVSVKHCCHVGTCDPASASFAARVFNP